MASQCFCMNHWHPSSFVPLLWPVRTGSQRLSFYFFFFNYTKELSPYPPNIPLLFSSKGNLALRISIKKGEGMRWLVICPRAGWGGEQSAKGSSAGQAHSPVANSRKTVEGQHVKYCIPSSCAASLAEMFSSHLKLFIGVIPTAHPRGRWSEHVGFMCHSSTWHNGSGLHHWP